MADIQKLKSLIADWESTSDDIPFGLDEDDRIILEAMKFAADNHDIAARLEAAEELNNHLELAVRKAEGVSEALRKRAEDAENKLLFTRAAPAAPIGLPEKWKGEVRYEHDLGEEIGWNSCLDEIKRLNGLEVSDGE